LQIYWVTQSVIQWAITFWMFKRSDTQGITIREFLLSFKK
jgi:hypothetical protein